MKTILLCVFVVAAFGVRAEADCITCSNPVLPAGTVTAQLDYGPNVGRPADIFQVSLTGLPLGYSVFNGTYSGWCADSYTDQILGPSPVSLYSSYSSALPTGDQNPNWDKINWVINHKGTHTRDEIQIAIWLLLGQPIPPDPPLNFTGIYTARGAVIDQFVKDAYKYGTGFHPGEGQALAVVLSVGGIKNPAVDPSNKHQTTFLELVCPLTQGYWKNHVSAWPATTINLGYRTFNTTVAADRSALLAIFNTPVKGNANIELEHQLIAAELNIAAGANPAPVQPAVTAGIQALTPTTGNPVPSSSPLGQAMTSFASALDSFNSGTLPGVCAH